MIPACFVGGIALIALGCIILARLLLESGKANPHV